MAPPTITRLFACGIATLAILLATGCSDKATPATTTPTTTPSTLTTVSAAPTTIPATTTTTTTVAPTTTAATSTTTPVVPTTVANTLTPDDQAQVDAQNAVADAARNAFETYQAVLQDPGNPDNEAALQRAATEPTLGRVLEVLQEFRVEGKRLVPNPDQPSSIIVDYFSIVVDVAAGQATVSSCETQTGAIVQTLADGTETVIVDTITMERLDNVFHLVDGTWKLAGATASTEIKATDSCS